MRAAQDIHDYRVSPPGVYLQVPSGLVFHARPELWGLVLWGRPTAEDVGRVLPLLRLQLAPSVAPHAMLVDFRRVEDANPGSFHVLCRFLQENLEPMGRQVTRVALVRPDGFQGMIIAGFHEVVRGRYPVGVFAELRAAADWIDSSDVCAELEELTDSAFQSSIAVARVRRWLDGEVSVPGASITLEDAARAIGRSSRSVQRDLQAVRSSFRREIAAARVRRAKRLLAQTETSLTDIAGAVGCASPQHFSVLFRRLVGTPPSAWRARHRQRN